MKLRPYNANQFSGVVGKAGGRNRDISYTRMPIRYREEYFDFVAEVYYNIIDNYWIYLYLLNTKNRQVIINEKDEGFSSLEEITAFVDQKLIEQGYTLLTQEQYEKLQILI